MSSFRGGFRPGQRQRLSDEEWRRRYSPSPLFTYIAAPTSRPIQHQPQQFQQHHYQADCRDNPHDTVSPVRLQRPPPARSHANTTTVRHPVPTGLQQYYQERPASPLEDDLSASEPAHYRIEDQVELAENYGCSLEEECCATPISSFQGLINHWRGYHKHVRPDPRIHCERIAECAVCTGLCKRDELQSSYTCDRCKSCRRIASIATAEHNVPSPRPVRRPLNFEVSPSARRKMQSNNSRLVTDFPPLPPFRPTSSQISRMEYPGEEEEERQQIADEEGEEEDAVVTFESYEEDPALTLTHEPEAERHAWCEKRTGPVATTVQAQMQPQSEANDEITDSLVFNTLMSLTEDDDNTAGATDTGNGTHQRSARGAERRGTKNTKVTCSAKRRRLQNDKGHSDDENENDDDDDDGDGNSTYDENETFIVPDSLPTSTDSGQQPAVAAITTTSSNGKTTTIVTPFRCVSGCDQVFPSQQRLLEHVRSVHATAGFVHLPLTSVRLIGLEGCDICFDVRLKSDDHASA